jgi:D-alanine-D-alanine ligase
VPRNANSSRVWGVGVGKTRGVTTAAVVFGGPSPEHDISILTGLQAARALVVADAAPGAIYWSKSGDFYLVSPTLEAAAFADGVPPKSEPLELVAGPGGGFVRAGTRFTKRTTLPVSAVVNACHGGPGEDGTLQAVLDLAGVPYTGPSAAGAALGMDKLAFAGIVASAGLTSLPRYAFSSDTPDSSPVPAPGFAGPYIVKPRFGGSSIGIEITDDIAVAHALVRSSPLYREGALIEPFLPDAIDLNISVRTFPHLALSPIERPLRREQGGRIYTYAEKYLAGGDGLASAPRELPAQLDPPVEESIRAAATRIADIALVRGVARIDFLLAGSELYINEINTIPGALSWYLWAAGGVPFATLLTDLIAEASARSARSWSTQGADGSALRAAGSIAGKLA